MALPIFPPLSVICNVRKLGRNDCTFSVHCLAPPQPNICAAFFGWCMLFLKCTNISRRSNVQELRYTRDNLISGYTHLALPVVKTALQRRSILGGQVCVGSNGCVVHAFFPATMNNRRAMNYVLQGRAAICEYALRACMHKHLNSLHA